MDSATEMKLLDFLRQTDEEWTETLKLAKAVGKTSKSHSAGSSVVAVGVVLQQIQPLRKGSQTGKLHQTKTNPFILPSSKLT